MDLSEEIAEDSLPLTVVALLGRAVGMMVPLVVARWFGADGLSDAFYLALTVPMFADALLATALHGTLGTLYARARRQGPGAAARFLGGSVITVGCVLLFAALCLTLGLPAAFEHLAPDRAPLAIEMLPPLMLALPLIGVNISLGTALELRGHFLIPAWLPAIKALAYLTVAGLLREHLGILALPAGYLMGELGQLLWLAVNLWRKAVPIGFGLGGTWGQLLAGLALFVPVALGDLSVHVNAFVDRIIAAGLGAGELSALEYADRARVIPEAVVGAGLLRVAFAYWANAQAGGREGEIPPSFAKVAAWIWILLIPGAAALILLRLPVVQVLYGGAAFGPAAVAETARTLMGYLPGVPLVMVGILALQLLWIRGDVRTVAIVGIISTVSNLAWDLALRDVWGALGLAAATSINQGIVAGVFLAVLRQRVPGILPTGQLLRGLLFAGGVVGLCFGLHALLGPIGTNVLQDLPKILIVLSVMGGVVIGGFGVRGELNAVLKLRLGREDGGGSEEEETPRVPRV